MSDSGSDEETSMSEMLATLAEQSQSQSKTLTDMISLLTKKKRKKSISPIKVKKVIITDPNVRSPAPVTNKLSRSSSGADSGHASGRVVQPGSSNSSASTSSDDVSDSFSQLEDALLTQYDENFAMDPSEKFDDPPPETESQDENLSIIGSEPQNNWNIPPNVLTWLKKILNNSIPDSTLKEINEHFSPPEDIKDLFAPAKFPEPLWQSIKTSTHSDCHKLKIVHSCQSKLLNSLKPLIAALETCQDPDTKENILTGIQMLASTNLDLNRFRRILAAPHLKNEYKPSFLKLPITHSSLFGEDFEKSSDKVVREHNAISKVVKPKWKKPFIPIQPQSKPLQPFRGGNSRGNYRVYRGNRGGGNRGGYSRGRGKGSATGTSTGSLPSQSQSQSSSSSQQ